MAEVKSLVRRYKDKKKRETRRKEIWGKDAIARDNHLLMRRPKPAQRVADMKEQLRRKAAGKRANPRKIYRPAPLKF
jgi:hypothetical protein